MRLGTLPLFGSLLLISGADPSLGARDALGATALAAGVAPPELAEAVDEPAPAPPLPPPVASPLRTTGAPVPADLDFTVREAKGGGQHVVLARKGHLVAMRHGEARTAGVDEAALPLPDDPAPIVWETTRLDTLATVRGTLEVRGDAAGKTPAGLRLVEAPVPAGRHEGGLHTCTAHEDAAGGFTVLCRVRTRATAANVTGEEASTDVWAAHLAAASVVRMDLPASPAGFEARALGYSAGVDGVVVRAEASRAAGEERAVLTLAAAQRAQPQIPMPPTLYRRGEYTGCCGY